MCVYIHTALYKYIFGGSPSEGIHAVQRVFELSREWSTEVCVGQMDIRKAFDRVSHQGVLQALQHQGASLQCQAVWAAMAGMSGLTFELGGARSERVPMQRGVPQGAPESPLLFVIAIEFAMAGLYDKWKREGLGWGMDDAWIGTIHFADDCLVIARSPAALALMIEDIRLALGQIGLDLASQDDRYIPE